MRHVRKPRVSAQYWIDVAIGELSEHGPDGLTIDALCRKSEKTKGSFYAHFANYDAFLVALAAQWRERNTEAVLRAANQESTPLSRLAMLNHIAVRLDARLDRGMRMLADRHPLVATAVAEVEELRIAYLADLYLTTGDYSENEATDLATIEYAAYVGLQVVCPKRDVSELERLYQSFTKLTTRHL